MVFYLVVLIYGGRYLFYVTSVDLGWHWVLTDYISQHLAVPSGDDPVLRVMSSYPPVSHVMAATIGSMIGSNLRALHLMSMASFITVYTLIAFTLWRRSWLAFLLFLAAAIPMGRNRLLIGHEVLDNCFYAQLVASALGLVLLVLTLTVRRKVLRRLTAIASVIVLSFTFTGAAVVFAAAYGFINLCEVLGERLRLWPWIELIGISLLLIAALVANPYFLGMVANSQYNGGISIGLSAGMAGVWGVVTVFVALLYGMNLRDDPALVRALVALAGGYGLTTAVQYFAMRFGWGSPYAVLKHVFGLGTYSLCLGALIATHVARRRGDEGSPFITAAASAILVAVVMFANIHNLSPVDIKRLENYDRDVRALTSGGTPSDLVNNAISFNSDFDVGMNFTIGLVALRGDGWMGIDQLRAYGFLQDPRNDGGRQARYVVVSSDQSQKLDAACRIAATGIAVVITRSCWQASEGQKKSTK